MAKATTSAGIIPPPPSASASALGASSRRNNEQEEGVGLLSAGARDMDTNADDDDHDDDHQDGSDESLVVVTSPRHASQPPQHQQQQTGGTRTLRTPRTPNRVRFDLRPTTILNPNSTSNGTAGSGSTTNHHAEHHHHARESFDIDDEDPLNNPSSSSHRVPLLTNLEAPSVALANSAGPWADDDDDDDDDDIHASLEAEHARPKSGLKMAFMNMANSIIGAGIIGQPYAFKQAGLLSGIILLVGLTFVVDWTIRLIVINSKLSGANSFQGTVEKCFGRGGLVAISVAQWAFAFGGMVAFGVIVGDSIPHVLTAVWPGLAGVRVVGLLADRRAVIVVFTLGVSYPLALYRDIAKLAKASTMALISMAIICVTVVVQGMLAPAEDRGTLKDFRLLVINDGIFQAIGVISFAFVCHHNSLLIYGSLKTPTIDRFARVTHLSTGISMIACLLMALAGFLTFGDKTLGNVLNNFPADNTMVNIARLCFGLNMLTTLPLEAFVCREVMFNYYYPNAPFNMKLHVVFTTCLVVGAMVVSLVTCDLGTVFELVGATSASAMAYILPPLCYIKLTTRSWKTYVAWAVAAFGCLVMGISVIQAVGKMVRGEGGSAQCM